MSDHRYRVGQTVRFIKVPQTSRLGGTPSGSFRVVRLLPDYQGVNQYHIESDNDGHKRLVAETEIASP